MYSVLWMGPTEGGRIQGTLENATQLTHLFKAKPPNSQVVSQGWDRILSMAPSWNPLEIDSVGMGMGIPLCEVLGLLRSMSRMDKEGFP